MKRLIYLISALFFPSNRFLSCVGTYTYHNEDKYVAEYKDDKIHGQGTYTFPGGMVYQEGIFKDGEFLYAQKKSKIDKHKGKEP